MVPRTVAEGHYYYHYPRLTCKFEFWPLWLQNHPEIEN